MIMRKLSIAETIAEFVSTLKYEDIPSDVVTYVKLLMIDTFGCIMPSITEPHAASVRAALEKLPNPPDATLWGTGEKASIDHAVMYNGCLIHGLDYDDTHGGAIIHPSSIVVNAAVSLGEQLGKDGKDILTAMVAAYEVLLRLGEACRGKMHTHFFHPTGIFAPFGTICVESSLEQVDRNTMVNALGLAGNFAAATMQFSVDGTWSKKLHPGWGAHAGLYAMRFAKEGYLSSPEIFEGPQGLFMSHIGTNEYLEETFSDFGARWFTKEIAFKFYPVCHMMHSHLDLLLHLMEEEHIGSGDIEEILAVLYPRAADIVALPPEKKKHPANDYLMRFSIQYSLAMAALTGRLSMREIDMEYLDQEQVQQMIERIEVKTDPTVDVEGHFPGNIRVKLKDGRVFERSQRYEVGSPENPAKKEDVLRKFYANTDGMISRENADRLACMIGQFEMLPNMDGLLALLQVG